MNATQHIRRPFPPFILMTAALVGLCAHVAPANWVYEGIEPEKTAGDESAALDAQDHAHVVYGRNALYYDWEEADGWHSETADGEAVPDKTAMVLDDAGLPHVVYLDILTGHVKYARKGPAGWSVETIADDPGGGRIAICLDAEDRPHVAYSAADGAPGDIAVVHLSREGSLWHRTVVGRWNGVKLLGAFVTAVADDGRPHVGWRQRISESDREYLWHAWKSAGSWQTVSVYVGDDSVSEAMQFDGMGRLHVAYEALDHQTWDGVIVYALGTEAGFSTEQLAQGYTRTWRFDGSLIRVSRDGIPHIVFDLYGDETGLQHWAKIDGAWQQSLIDPATEPPDATSYGYSLALDSAGRPHVIYRLLWDFSNGWLNSTTKTAWQDAEGWHSQSEPSAPPLAGSALGDGLLVTSGNEARFLQSNYRGSATLFSSQTGTEWRHRRLAEEALDGIVDVELALDGQGNPHIAYASPTLGSKYAWHDASGWHTTWLPEVAAPDPITISIAIDGEGRPHVAYQRRRGLFSHGVLEDGEWDVAEIVTDALWMDPVMALDGMDRPHFMAMEQRPDWSWELAYYRPVADGWQRETVSSSDGYHWLSGIALDRDGNPHTVYIAGSQIWYGHRTTRGWQLSEVVSPPGDYYGIYLCGPVIDGRNQIHICWSVDSSSGADAIYHARKDLAGWHATEIATGSPFYRLGSLALGVDGAPQITYMDFGDAFGSSENTLVFGRMGAEGWELAPVGKIDNRDIYHSMAVDPHGRPHIACVGVREQLGYLWPPTAFHRLDWSAISSPQEAGVPIPVTLTARSADGENHTAFADTVTLAGSVPGVAATDRSLGAGTNTWEYPLFTEYHDARTTVIYEAVALGQDCTITSLALEVTTPPGQTIENWTIRMKRTGRTTYVSLSPAAWETDGWTVVYQGDGPAGTAGWRTFQFSTPYEFSLADGGNLLVDFSFNNASYSTAGECRASEMGTGVSITGYSDSRNGDPLDWSGANPELTVSRLAPNIVLGVTVPVRVPVSVSPASVGPFVDGVWTGTVTVMGNAADLILLADDGAGHGGESNPFTVQGISQPLLIVNDGSFGLSGGSFGFNLQGQDGRVVVVEVSPDLLGWLPLQTNTLGSAPVYFSDPSSSIHEHRFYRLLQAGD